MIKNVDKHYILIYNYYNMSFIVNNLKDTDTLTIWIKYNRKIKQGHTRIIKFWKKSEEIDFDLLDDLRFIKSKDKEGYVITLKANNLKDYFYYICLFDACDKEKFRYFFEHRCLYPYTENEKYQNEYLQKKIEPIEEEYRAKIERANDNFKSSIGLVLFFGICIIIVYGIIAIVKKTTWIPLPAVLFLGILLTSLAFFENHSLIESAKKTRAEKTVNAELQNIKDTDYRIRNEMQKAKIIKENRAQLKNALKTLGYPTSDYLVEEMMKFGNFDDGITEISDYMDGCAMDVFLAHDMHKGHLITDMTKSEIAEKFVFFYCNKSEIENIVKNNIPSNVKKKYVKRLVSDTAYEIVPEIEHRPLDKEEIIKLTKKFVKPVYDYILKYDIDYDD